MAIAFDAVCPATSSGAGVTSLTSGSWTVAAGSDRCLFGFMSTGDSAAASHTGMKWRGSGGDALTQVGSTQPIGSTHANVSAWRLIAPTAESNTAYGNWGASQGEACIAMLSYTGVDQTTPAGTPVSATGGTSNPGGTATATVDVTTEVGDTVIAVCMSHNQSISTNITLAAAGGATSRYEVDGAVMGGYAAMIVTELVASGTTTTMSVDVASAEPGHSVNWRIYAFVINAAEAADESILPQMMHHHG